MLKEKKAAESRGELQTWEVMWSAVDPTEHWWLCTDGMSVKHTSQRLPFPSTFMFLTYSVWERAGQRVEFSHWHSCLNHHFLFSIPRLLIHHFIGTHVNVCVCWYARGLIAPTPAPPRGGGGRCKGDCSHKIPLKLWPNQLAPRAESSTASRHTHRQTDRASGLQQLYPPSSSTHHTTLDLALSLQGPFSLFLSSRWDKTGPAPV